MYKCKYCGKEFEKVYSLAAHVSMCKLNPNYENNIKKRSLKRKGISTITEKKIQKFPEKYIKKEFNIICPKCGKEFIVICTQNNFDKGNYKHYCSRKCANSHIVSEETKRNISIGVKNSELYYTNNKLAVQKRVLSHEKIIYCKNCGKSYSNLINGKIIYKNFCSDNCKKEYIHNVHSKNGGFKEGSVKNFKSGWYKGIHCDSSWELSFLIYNFEHNIKVERCKEVRYYLDINGVKHEFHPDFIIDNKIYEIKGLQDINYINKQNYNKDIIFLFKSDMEKYLTYVKDKYGENFIDLYEKKDKNPI